MKTMKCFTLCLFIFFSGHAIASGNTGVGNASLSGHWEGSWQYSDKSYVEKFSFDLTESGGVITGTGVDDKGISAKVSGASKDSSFTLTVAPEDGNPPITFSGQINKDAIRGTWIVGRSSGPWSAVKQ